MSDLAKKEPQKEAIVGEHAATQPLSGIDLVSKMRFKGFNGTAFVHVEETARLKETKKAV